jgi:hypothetical protein
MPLLRRWRWCGTTIGGERNTRITRAGSMRRTADVCRVSIKNEFAYITAATFGSGEIPEDENDVAVSQENRQEAIAAARRWIDGFLIAPGTEGREVVYRRTREPLLMASPPGGGGFGPKYKRPMLRTVLNPDDYAEDPRYLAALREDRLFRVNAWDDALARVREFGNRILVEDVEFDVQDASCFSFEPSTEALRLTAREAIDVVAHMASPSWR